MRKYINNFFIIKFLKHKWSKYFSFEKMIFVLFPFFIFGCVKILTPKLPSWQTQLTIPLVDRTFTLEDFMKKSSSLFIDSTNGEISYRPAEIQNKPDTIKLPSFSPQPSRVSQVIGPLPWPNINLPPSISSFKNITGQDPPVIPFPGADIIGIFTKDVNLDISGQLDVFDFGTFEDGSLEITFINTFAFGFNFTNGIAIRNRDDNSLVAQYPAFILAAGETKKMSVVVTGKTLKDQISISGNFQTQNITGKIITSLNTIAISTQITGSSGTGNASLSEAKILFVGNIDLVNLPNESDQILDDSTYYKTLEFSKGGFDIRVVNGTNFGVKVVFEIKEFINKSSSQPFFISGTSKEATISKNATFLREVLLVDYKLQSQELNNAPTNKINFNLKIQTLIPSFVDKILVRKTDSVVAEIVPKKDNLGSTIPYKLHKVLGKITPITIAIDQTMPLATGDFKTKFKADSIMFDSLYLAYKLFTSGLFPTDISLKIYAINSNGIRGDSLTLPTNFVIPISGKQVRRILPGQIDSIVFNKNNSTLDRFISSFISNGQGFFPDSIRIKGTVEINPIDVYKDPNSFGGATDGDTIVTSVRFAFPMRIGIKNGTLRDTTIIGDTTASGTGSNKIDKESLSNIVQGKIFFSIENTFPFQIQIKAGLYDKSKDNFSIPDTIALMYLPMNKDTILVDSARYSQSPVRPGKSYTAFALTPADVDKFNPATFMTLAINIRTSGNGDKAVIFRKDNYLHIKSFASVTFNVDFNKKK
ncbi:MAG: hypothetical protein AAB255_01790 [Bacteroidota bacterium]